MLGYKSEAEGDNAEEQVVRSRRLLRAFVLDLAGHGAGVGR